MRQYVYVSDEQLRSVQAMNARLANGYPGAVYEFTDWTKSEGKARFGCRNGSISWKVVPGKPPMVERRTFDLWRRMEGRQDA